MNKPIAITPETMLRDARLFDDAPVGNDVGVNDVGDAQEPSSCLEPSIGTRSEDCTGLPVGDSVVGALEPSVRHTAKSDDRCALPKVRAAYVKPEIVSRELTLKRVNPCDL